MIQQFFSDQRPHEGLSYAAYLDMMATEAAQDTAGFSAEDVQQVEFTRLNLHRSRRIARTYKMDRELARLLDGIAQPQLWMVLTEPWCGDSAQCLPYIALLADRNPHIDLRVLLRDDNLDIMNLYLTNGTLSIPQLVVFADDGRELFRWGARPVAAQEVFVAAKAAGLEKPQIMEKLHLWYGRNRGEALEAEFIALLDEV